MEDVEHRILVVKEEQVSDENNQGGFYQWPGFAARHNFAPSGDICGHFASQPSTALHGLTA